MARIFWTTLVIAALLGANRATAQSTDDAVRERDDQIAELMRKVDVLTDEVATLVLRKDSDHTINRLRLRKL